MSHRPPRDFERAVKACYATWSRSYYRDYYQSPEAYPPVHRELVRGLLQELKSGSLLDAGCGPASLLRDLTDLGLELYGFDLTPEMVEEARRVLAPAGVPPEHIWQGSVLEAEDFRRVTPPGGAFDAAICIGVLPHVPAEADEVVLANLRRAVRPGGRVVVEARNQLFALFTLNRYSHQLFLQELIAVEELRALAGEEEAPVLEECLQELAGMFRTDLPPVRKGKEGEPGYDQVLSRTHNPLVLREQFAAAGFQEVELLFYHYHCLPPMFESRLPELFRRASLAREDPRDWRGHFLASAFLLTGRRT